VTHDTPSGLFISVFGMGRLLGVSDGHRLTTHARFVAMDVTELAPAPVEYPELARLLDLTPQQRADILREGLVRPVGGSARQGAPTWITPESADLLREAKGIVDRIKKDPAAMRLAVGVTVIVVLRLLTSGAVRPA
jgi:hypothetical protein